MRLWCKTEDYWTVHQAAVRALKYALDEAHIGVPFPQVDVHLRALGQGAEALRLAGAFSPSDPPAE